MLTMVSSLRRTISHSAIGWKTRPPPHVEHQRLVRGAVFWSAARGRAALQKTNVPCPASMRGKGRAIRSTQCDQLFRGGLEGEVGFLAFAGADFHFHCLLAVLLVP